jgi:hypothetical protein
MLPDDTVAGGAACEPPDTKVVKLIRDIHGAVHGQRKSPEYRYADLGELDYLDTYKIQRHGCHHGQRKLLMTEIQFFSNHECDVIVYTGSAPSQKLPMLLDMFPRKKFLLIDPNYHQFAAPFVLVYQNTHVIDKGNWKDSAGDARRGNKGKEGAKRYENIRTSLAAPVYGAANQMVNMLDIYEPKHIAAMDGVHSKFKEDRYVTLFGDIVSGDDRVYVIQDYMGRELADLLAKSKEAAKTTVSFVSDIRTNLFAGHPTDVELMWNDALQIMVLKKLRPMYSMLKFHPPYMVGDAVQQFVDGKLKSKVPGMEATIMADFDYVRAEYGLDMLGEYAKRNNKYPYFAADIVYVQAWAPTGSSEARLIIKDVDAPWHNYSPREWDRRFSYNKFMRGVAYYGTFYDKLKGRRDHPWDACYDCMLDIFILGNYLWRSDGLTMDAPMIAAKLEKCANQDKLIELRRRIDEQMVYGNFQKCIGTHGHLVGVPKTPYRYRYDVSKGKVIINRMWIDGRGNFKSAIVGSRIGGRTWLSDDSADYQLAGNLKVPRPDDIRKRRGRWVEKMGAAKL